jgi:hypothetical protein
MKLPKQIMSKTLSTMIDAINKSYEDELKDDGYDDKYDDENDQLGLTKKHIRSVLHNDDDTCTIKLTGFTMYDEDIEVITLTSIDEGYHAIFLKKHWSKGMITFVEFDVVLNELMHKHDFPLKRFKSVVERINKLGDLYEHYKDTNSELGFESDSFSEYCLYMERIINDLYSR